MKPGDGLFTMGPTLAQQVHRHPQWRWATEVRPADPLTMAAVVAALAVTTFAAGCTPARRAPGLDPAVALRDE